MPSASSARAAQNYGGHLPPNQAIGALSIVKRYVGGHIVVADF
ncbi:hypothetical protein [Glaciimonas sp. PCH181]|nr:hypothetical protein [Glaciimonas sp. PCH181]